jgi:NAD(P)-dependent dehydrogenase (short-subunit alcohol dehydrogenase family)
MNVYTLFNLKGKTAVVTGGAGHLGSAISSALSEAGANVFIASRNVEQCNNFANQLSKHNQTLCKGVALDIRDISSVQQCFQKIIDQVGSIDVLVNNAFFGTSAIFDEMTEDQWIEGIDGTINGIYRCTKTVLPYMKQQKSGSIINISSMYGVVSPNPELYGESGYDNPAFYGTGKAGIIQFTRYIACHNGKYGIRVNSVSPGPFPSPAVQQNSEFIGRLIEKNPLGRIGHPDDLKGIMVLLASPASAYITGQNFCVDGGWTAW